MFELGTLGQARMQMAQQVAQPALAPAREPKAPWPIQHIVYIYIYFFFWGGASKSLSTDPLRQTNVYCMAT